jgi:hypothetical protein
VRNYVVPLTSTQVLLSATVFDHYLFQDTSSFVWSNTAISDDTVLTNDNTWSTTVTWSSTGDAGAFYPPQYLQGYDTVTYLSAGTFKGPYTITFCPSGIDTRYYGITKIIYNFGDGSNNRIVVRSILSNAIAGGLTTAGDPVSTNVSHDYYPVNNGITTYYPVVSVINGSLLKNIFYITLTFAPASIYDFNTMHLISNVQSSSNYNETINIFETKTPSYVTNVRVISGV